MGSGGTAEGGYDRSMKVRIGIANTDKLVEIEVDDEGKFRKEISKALDNNGMGWFKDSKGQTIGIPAKNIAFVQIEDADTGHTVGFAPAG